MVLRSERARPPPFAGEDVTGAVRWLHILGRNMPTFGDCRTRWIRRLYAATNSVHVIVSLDSPHIAGVHHTLLWCLIQNLAAHHKPLEHLIFLVLLQQRRDFGLDVRALVALGFFEIVDVLCELVAKFLKGTLDKKGGHGARHIDRAVRVYAWERRGRGGSARGFTVVLCGVDVFEWDVCQEFTALSIVSWSVRYLPQPWKSTGG